MASNAGLYAKRRLESDLVSLKEDAVKAIDQSLDNYENLSELRIPALGVHIHEQVCSHCYLIYARYAKKVGLRSSVERENPPGDQNDED